MKSASFGVAWLCASILCLVGAPAFGQSSGVTEEWVHLPIRVLFSEGSSSLDAMSRALLRELHASITYRTDVAQVQVEGHTAPTGAEANSSQLALERARSVVSFLVNDMGMPQSLFKVVSYSSSRPITQGDSVQNRRVEFSILVRRPAP